MIKFRTYLAYAVIALSVLAAAPAFAMDNFHGHGGRDRGGHGRDHDHGRMHGDRGHDRRGHGRW